MLSVLFAVGGFDGCGDPGVTFPDGGPPVVCGGRECPSTKCNVGWTCDADGQCVSKGDPAGYDDHDECTEDTCDDATGEITHRAYATKDLDDGDSCTTDACTAEFGITHAYNCSATCNKDGC